MSGDDPLAGIRAGNTVRLPSHAYFPMDVGTEWLVVRNGPVELTLQRASERRTIPKHRIVPDVNNHRRFHTYGRFSNDHVAVYEVVPHGT